MKKKQAKNSGVLVLALGPAQSALLFASVSGALEQELP
jgi:hypothetical protein